MTNITKIIYRSTFCICLAFLIFSCDKTSTCDCEQFKNGNFIYKSGGTTFLIKRQDSIQIETDQSTGYYSKLLVKWTDKCCYEGLESTFPFSDSLQKVRKAIPIKVKIISSGKGFYIFKAHRDNSHILTDTIWVNNTK